MIQVAACARPNLINYASARAFARVLSALVARRVPAWGSVQDAIQSSIQVLLKRYNKELYRHSMFVGKFHLPLLLDTNT
jgi:hypothetical protein